VRPIACDSPENRGVRSPPVTASPDLDALNRPNRQDSPCPQNRLDRAGHSILTGTIDKQSRQQPWPAPAHGRRGPSSLVKSAIRADECPLQRLTSFDHRQGLEGCQEIT